MTVQPSSSEAVTSSPATEAAQRRMRVIGGRECGLLTSVAQIFSAMNVPVDYLLLSQRDQDQLVQIDITFVSDERRFDLIGRKLAALVSVVQTSKLL